jgi:ubiquitin C-terminal hydrolase
MFLNSCYIYLQDVANVKVNEKWFHCNDAHVAQAGIGIGEREVLQSNAYLLFYIRSK